MFYFMLFYNGSPCILYPLITYYFVYKCNWKVLNVSCNLRYLVMFLVLPRDKCIILWGDIQFFFTLVVSWKTLVSGKKYLLSFIEINKQYLLIPQTNRCFPKILLTTTSLFEDHLPGNILQGSFLFLIHDLFFAPISFLFTYKRKCDFPLSHDNI